MSGWPQLLGKVFGLAVALYVGFAFTLWFKPYAQADDWGVIALTFGAIVVLNYVLADRDERQEFRADARRIAHARALGWQGFARRMQAYWRF